MKFFDFLNWLRKFRMKKTIVKVEENEHGRKTNVSFIKGDIPYFNSLG